MIVETVKPETMSVRELVTKLYEAAGKMSTANPHRALILHAMSALLQLSGRIEAEAAMERPRVELAH